VRDSYGIHWFRRDLRIEGNPALAANLERHGGRVLGLFCFDPAFLARPDFSAGRFQFFLETLSVLRADLQAAGGELLFLAEGPMQSFPRLFEFLPSRPATVSFNRDYEPYARTRDSEVSRLLEERFGIEVITARDHLMLEPGEVLKDDGSPYVVFTPFKRRWLERFAEVERRAPKPGPARLALDWTTALGRSPASVGCGDLLGEYLEKNGPLARLPRPMAGRRAALEQLKAFASKQARYAETRDLPAVAGTSQLSVYLKNGSLTCGEIVSQLGLRGSEKYFDELVWREFYYQILFHFPNVERQAFNPRYRTIRWENNAELFDAWREGRTGFPIVDAGMRQLASTGWMHNRVRMIVASFLVKDLHIDWRSGERWFMRNLLDGDLAANNGGWQWAASTGCDPQPYFRVFNPTLQGRKFDPDGEYVRRWVPELAALPVKEIHEPRHPVVDHSARAKAAVELFKNAALQAT
jgi:deoxyribodipyrimidine photo-lyase